MEEITNLEGHVSKEKNFFLQNFYGHNFTVQNNKEGVVCKTDSGLYSLFVEMDGQSGRISLLGDSLAACTEEWGLDPKKWVGKTGTINKAKSAKGNEYGVATPN